MDTTGPSRRSFLVLSAAAALAGRLPGQATSLAHADVAGMEHDRILAEAREALKTPVQPLTGIEAPHGNPGQFFSEIEPNLTTAGALPAPKLFREHAISLRLFSATVACLSAASLITGDPTYAKRAAEHLRAWLTVPNTRMQPSFELAGCSPGMDKATPTGVVDLVPIAELARASSFLTDNAGLDDDELENLHAWFGDLLVWLNSNRNASIARESKDHRASAWLIIAAAIARFNRDESALEALRKRFRSPTLRNQIRADGVFPQEVATPLPYRNTLFNFDLLAGACQLLNSPFDLLWDYELVDGVGFRIAAAFLYPVIAHPEKWGYVADAQHFRDLPGRRAGLLFAGRAYNRPEYVELWKQLPPTPPPEVVESFPIRQPLLWTARALHGM